MCKFLSALVTRDGRILRSDYTDSHEDLILIHQIRDYAPPEVAGFVRVEFTPPRPDDLALPERYVLTVDQPVTPAWWDTEIQERVADDLRGVVSRMIVRDQRPLLIGGAWILADGGEVARAAQARIIAVESGGTVQCVLSGGTVQSVESGGTVQCVWSGGTVQCVLSGGTVQSVESGGTVQCVWSGGTVQCVLSGGTVQSVESGGTVQCVWSGGTVQCVLSGGTVQSVESGGTVQSVEK